MGDTMGECGGIVEVTTWVQMLWDGERKMR